MVLHQRHFCHQIRRLDQFRLGVAACHHNGQVFASVGEGGNHLIQRQIIIAQGDIQLIQHQQANVRVGHQLACLGEGGLRSGNIARLVLRFPGETLAHGVPADLVAKTLERRALAGFPRALDELDDAHLPAMAESA